MKKLFFINLAVDQLWDNQAQLTTLFSTRVPRSEDIMRTNEDLAIYLCDQNDIALIYSDAPHTLIHKNVIRISANPFNSLDWLKEVSTRLTSDETYELWPVSISPVELGLLKQFKNIKLPSWLPENFPANELNRKTLIEFWSQISGIVIPQTTKISIQEILADSFYNESDFPFYLKAEFGSGGGANFLVQNSSDSSLKVIRRQLSQQTNGNWIKQKYTPAKENFSVFGWADSSYAKSQGQDNPMVMKIAYDDRGQSIAHELVVPNSLAKFDNVLLNDFSKNFYQPFQNISDHLNSKYNYFGPFGLDLIQSQKDELLLVDVNIRWTKTHLIVAAAKKLKVDLKNSISRRIKQPPPDFLYQHRDQIVTYLVTGYSSTQHSATEINFFEKTAGKLNERKD